MTSNYERFGIVDADMEHNRKMRSILTVRRFHYAEERDDIEAALGLGNDALGGGLVSADTVEACQSWTGRCFFVRKSNTGQTEGFIGLLHLSQDGVNALIKKCDDLFDCFFHRVFPLTNLLCMTLYIVADI